MMRASTRASWGSYLEILRREAPRYEELARTRAIRAQPEGIDLRVDLHRSGLTQETQQWLDAGPKNLGHSMDLWMRAEIVARGPKIFQPTLGQCLVMEQIAPRLATVDYAQPYPVMVVEFPEPYRLRRAILAQPQLHSGAHAPEFALVGFHPPPVASVWLQIVLSSGIAVRLATLPGDATIEDAIVREHGKESYPSVDLLVPSEHVMLASVSLLAVNAMLLMMEYGCKRRQPANPAHYARLQHYVEVARKRGQRIAEAERELRLAGQLYGLDQEIVLHEESRANPGMQHDEEAHRKPHWRRGHWKMHAHGPGLRLRKRILIKPVFVNVHRLANEAGPIQTRYRAT